jgi:hypothetical protein
LEGEMGEDVPSRQPVELRHRRLRGFSHRFSAPLADRPSADTLLLDGYVS